MLLRLLCLNSWRFLQYPRILSAIIEHDPLVRKRSIQFLEIAPSPLVAPANVSFGDIVSSLPHSSFHSLNREFDGGQLDSFKDKIRNMTRRSNGLSTRQLIEGINPVLRGWGNYYRIGHVRKLFNRLGRWIVRRIWSHRKKRWRNSGWRELPEPRLYGEFGLVNLVDLIAGIRARGKAPKLL